MKKPWYIIEFEEKIYLHNKRIQLKRIEYESDQHEHCELCWARFSLHKDDLQFGYYESDSRSWICQTCCKDFKDLFKWTVEE